MTDTRGRIDGGGHERWPKCAKCTMDRGAGAPVPVEEYSVERVGADSLIIDGSSRGRIVVVARCRHADLAIRSSSEFRRRDPEVQHSTIDVPTWWSDRMVLDAVASLTFFRPGQGAPVHTLVTAVG